LHLRESQMKADALLNEAKLKANNTIDESEQRSKMVLAEMEERLRNMVEDYKRLKTSREDLLLELKRISGDTIDRVERLSKTQNDFDADQHLAQTRKEIKKVIFPNHDQPTSKEKQDQVKSIVQMEPVIEKGSQESQEVVEKEAIMVGSRQKVTSFFDEIG